MAFDFILGSTGTNWSRGIKQLLPDTPDSTSMGGQQPMPSPPQSPGEDSEAYWAKLQRDMENIRQNVWRGSYPMVLDAGSVANMLTSPELTSEQMAVRKIGILPAPQLGKSDLERWRAPGEADRHSCFHHHVTRWQIG